MYRKSSADIYTSAWLQSLLSIPTNEQNATDVACVCLKDVVLRVEKNVEYD